MQNTLDLSVDTGSLVIDLKNERGRKIGEFEIIPTDTDILKRYEKVVDFFNNVSFGENVTEKEIIKFSEDVKKKFDELFNYHVSENIFGTCGPLTVVSNGDFFFERVLEGIAGLIEKIMNERIQKKLNKIKNATSKYHN